MQIIPVIDLKDGQVVHAVGGHRALYQPIDRVSRITQHSDLQSVIAAFDALIAFDCCYIADLNAISGNGNHQIQIEALANRRADLTIWLDDGQIWPCRPHRHANVLRVIGSESQITPITPVDADCILSLDYKNAQPAGHPSWFSQSDCWPSQVVAMTLNRVGSDSGPDYAKLTQLIEAHPNQRWIAAGGVRDHSDLEQLTEIGITAALVATALHNGRLSS